MSPKLYMIKASPPARAVFLTAKALNLDLDLINVDLLTKEQLKPEFLNINPQHTVPVLDDDGFILVDSHAINVYLAEKYGKNSTLYPNDIKERAIVNHRLHFDNGTLFVRMANIVRGVLYNNEKTIPKEKIDAVLEAYKILEAFLQSYPWMAGQQMTVADLAIVSTVTSVNVFVPINEEYPKLASWLKKMEALPYYSANKEGLEMFTCIMKSKMGN
ncbi:unnamed protein product [Brassicogethes aeneus]|uniref:Uncharacterized protein n=1 Tax=Brassicogethes aeneus TaxID=1431903 RepID=A0A9P0FBP6_BRAAE|nr:unnamed protein product [Brassicogethes aeneus]